MADLPSVAPSSPAKPVAGNTTPQTNISNATVQEAPPALTTPPAPVQLSGTVLSSNPQTQQMNIQTPQGQIVVQTTVALPQNTPVSLEIFTAGAQTRATITVIRQSAAQAQTAAQTVKVQDLQTLENAVQAAPAALQEGGTVTALQLPGYPPAATGMAAQAPAAQSPDLLQQIVSTYLPEDAGSTTAAPDVLDQNLLHIMRAQLLAKAAQAALQSAAPRNGKPENFLPLASTLDMLAAALGEEKPQGMAALMRQLMPQDLKNKLPLPQNMFRVRILKILPPDTTPAQIEAAQAKTETSGEEKTQIANVETATSGGRPILQTEDGGHFVITTPVSVPDGSKLILTVEPMTAQDILQEAMQGLRAAPEDKTWQSLQQALQTLTPAQEETAVAAALLRNTLPTPTQRLVPTALFFLAALRTGDIKNWLGENTLRLIEKTAEKGTADALASDFGRMSAQSKTALPGGWRAISIPLRNEEQISQMQFYVRRQDEREQKGELPIGAKPAMRFILDMIFSRLGPLQLDGYIHKKAFDMVLRTEEALPLDMRQELMKRFAQGLAQVDMQGGLAFQTRKQGWMVPEVAHMKTEV